MSSLTRPLFQARQQPFLILQRGLRKNVKVPVTLVKDVPGLGASGTVVHVHKAHMRHNLFPKRLAEYVISRKGPLDRKAMLEAEAEEKDRSLSKKQIDVEQDVHSLALRNQDIISRIAKLEPLVFERSAVVTESGGEENTKQAIYGSLSKADVIRELADKHEIIIDKDALSMDDKIKSVGEYTCIAKLIYAGSASFKCIVVPASTIAATEQQN